MALGSSLAAPGCCDHLSRKGEVVIYGVLVHGTSCALALVKPQRSAPFSCATSLPFLAALPAADFASRPCSEQTSFSRPLSSSSLEYSRPAAAR